MFCSFVDHSVLAASLYLLAGYVRLPPYSITPVKCPLTTLSAVCKTLQSTQRICCDKIQSDRQI